MIRNVGASQISWVSGVNPMRNVATAIRTIAVINTGLRPTLSPKCPAITPPNGRAANATANVAKELTADTTGSPVSKKVLLKTSAAAVP